MMSLGYFWTFDQLESDITHEHIHPSKQSFTILYPSNKKFNLALNFSKEAHSPLFLKV